ncbi:MAG TPA: acyl-CoA dehydrogenase family protein [Elainellaceae cyanobacterium]
MLQLEIAPEQNKALLEFRAFVNERIIPHAAKWDQERYTPKTLIEEMAQRGYLGAVLPVDYVGSGMDMITFGFLNQEIGRGCSSIRSLLTVHSMVSHTLHKWGSQTQKATWLPQLASGKKIAAFALSEPHIGSDAKNIETTAIRVGDSYYLNGQKKWITYGQIADIFLVFAQYEGNPAAFIIEKDYSGLSIEPINNIVGVRASMLAELKLDNCQVPLENLVSKPGLGFSFVANTALNYGRYSVAWGCVGISQACLEACLRYTIHRKQFGVCLKEHPLIRQLITEMVTNIKAARLLCFNAGCLKDSGHSKSISEISIAKYFASKTASQIAHDAVQIHGANGCSQEFAVERYWRDAKIMEIIEGSTQIQQLTIAEYGYQEHRETLNLSETVQPKALAR